MNSSLEQWNRWRGKSVDIELPATPIGNIPTKFCDGPFYLVVGGFIPGYVPAHPIYVCPCVAEIGD
jgi:hypothetical protein